MAERILKALVPLIAVGVMAVSAAAASGSRTLPVSPIYLGATAASHALKVRPATIVYTGDGTGLLAGAHVSRHSSPIRWRKWTTRVALGSGYNQLNDCRPDCADGTFHGFPVRIELWRPRTLGGRRVFTRLTIF